MTSERSPAAAALENIFPKTYHTDKEEIIMEDLASRGFRMINKIEKHDFSMAK